ncbi:NAD(P)/FAD-dependent oxidoreductase [Agreia sp. COWG]|uniref:NAD(P)/FAD-dependent oxidoreductase n=1 Tax=Agreia sp. COWG TaxID=2773266 RepID=UPI00192967F9|nr:NAD(P)-binding protein [Agreia sp. COWG]CAD6009343.1 putative Renalase [Agreia sp. COWG]
MEKSPVLIVGAGISGIACAQALRSAGRPVRVVDRGRVPGGRMASRSVGGRPVDIGAAYFTAKPGTPFAAVVDDWVERGLARPWTDTVAVANDSGITGSTTGPMRYAAAKGLRSLVEDLAQGIDVEQGITLEHVSPGEALGESCSTVVLAMPDPQARRLLDASSPLREKLDHGSGWAPSIAVGLEFSTRSWKRFHTAFVNEHPVLTSLADDGDRRGDGRPVLVAQTTAPFAQEHLDEPDGAIEPVSTAVRRLLSLPDAPVNSFAHRWTFARPESQHSEPFLLVDGLGVCGDAWGERSSVSTAWASGDALGRAIAQS